MMISRFWSVPILAYHKIGEPEGNHIPTITPEAFERQLQFMSRRRFRILAMTQLVDALSHGEPLPRRSAVITFDDGYEETFTRAAPLLERFGFSGTVFVTPTEIGLPGFMTWDQVRSLAQNGMTVGSHTLHHTYLPLVSSVQIQQELLESKALLERQIGQPVHWLSYPVGGFTPTIQALAREAGYRAACTTNRGLSKSNGDLFALRRIKMTERDQHPVLLGVKLSGYYDLFRRLEAPA